MPKTDSKLLKFTVVVLSALWIALGFRIAFVNNFGLVSTAIAATVVVPAVGLWRLQPFARSITKFTIGAYIVLDMLATFGPFYGLDHRAASYGGDISWASVLMVHIPVITVGLLFFWLLDRYKSSFPPGRQQINDSAA